MKVAGTVSLARAKGKCVLPEQGTGSGRRKSRWREPPAFLFGERRNGEAAASSAGISTVGQSQVNDAPHRLGHAGGMADL